MKKGDGKRNQHTVMLAADAGSYSITTVNLAVQMAASMKTRLRGLFIEDEDLLRVTGLPFTREISLVTARERPTDVERMQRSMRSVARQFEQTLKQEAAASRIAWSFDYVRGRVCDIGLKTDPNVTYIILGQPASHRVRARPERVPRKILMIANRSRNQQRALEVLLKRFRGHRTEVTLVGVEPDGKLTAGVEQLTRGNGAEISLIELSRERLSELLNYWGSGFDCAIVSRHENPDQLARILKSLSCPVILVA